MYGSRVITLLQTTSTLTIRHLMDTVPPLFEVEHILQCRKAAGGGGLEYLVSWVGYSEAATSWEPAANLALAPDVMASFAPEAAMVIPSGGGAGSVCGQEMWPMLELMMLRASSSCGGTEAAAKP